MDKMRLIDIMAAVTKISKKVQPLLRIGGSTRELYDTILGCLAEAPTVEAVEVVHGHWKEYLHSALVRWKDGEPVWADRSVFRCSRCDFGTIARHNYCPRCGAKMDGGNEDGDSRKN